MFEEGEEQKIQAAQQPRSLPEIAPGDYKTSLQFIMGDRSISPERTAMRC